MLHKKNMENEKEKNELNSSEAKSGWCTVLPKWSQGYYRE